MLPPVCSCLSPFLWDHPASSSPSRDLGLVFAWWEESAWKQGEAALAWRGEGCEGRETSARGGSVGCWQRWVCCGVPVVLTSNSSLPLLHHHHCLLSLVRSALWVSLFWYSSCIWTMGLFATTVPVVVVGRIYGAVQVMEICENPSDSLFRAVILSIWC